MCFEADLGIIEHLDITIMADLVKELLTYISTTPRDQRMKDWNELSAYGEFGPNAFEYLDSVYEKIPEMQISNRCLNPEFSLDFLF